MNFEDKKKLVDIVSDVFFEISNKFDILLLPTPGSSGLNLESETDKKYINNILNKEILMDFRIISRAKFSLHIKSETYKISVQKKLGLISKDIIKKYSSLEKRLKFLVGDNFHVETINPFVLLHCKKGLVLLPLFEKYSSGISIDSLKRMNESGYNFTSYEKDFSQIDNIVDMEFVSIYFNIKEIQKENFIDKIKKFKFFN